MSKRRGPKAGPDGDVIRARLDTPAPLSDRIQARQTAFRDEGDVWDRRGYIVDGGQLDEVIALERRLKFTEDALDAYHRAALHEGGNNE